jgi:hypothetical protein
MRVSCPVAPSSHGVHPHADRHIPIIIIIPPITNPIIARCRARTVTCTAAMTAACLMSPWWT